MATPMRQPGRPNPRASATPSQAPRRARAAAPAAAAAPVATVTRTTSRTTTAPANPRPPRRTAGAQAAAAAGGTNQTAAAQGTQQPAAAQTAAAQGTQQPAAAQAAAAGGTTNTPPPLVASSSNWFKNNWGAILGGLAALAVIGVSTYAVFFKKNVEKTAPIVSALQADSQPGKVVDTTIPTVTPLATSSKEVATGGIPTVEMAPLSGGVPHVSTTVVKPLAGNVFTNIPGERTVSITGNSGIINLGTMKDVTINYCCGGTNSHTSTVKVPEWPNVPADAIGDILGGPCANDTTAVLREIPAEIPAGADLIYRYLEGKWIITFDVDWTKVKGAFNTGTESNPIWEIAQDCKATRVRSVRIKNTSGSTVKLTFHLSRNGAVQ